MEWTFHRWSKNICSFEWTKQDKKILQKKPAAFGSRTGQYTTREKNSFTILANSNINFFFHKLKTENSLHMSFKFYYSRLCK